MHVAHQYARQVLSGKIVAGSHVRHACQRHLDDLQRPDLFFDEDAANRVMRFFQETLYIPRAEGGYELFVLLPYQCFILSALFGWKRPDGLRRFRRSYIEGAKGCGKSPFAGGVMLYCLVADGEMAGQNYVIARTADQALVSFRTMTSMVRNSPRLEKACSIRGGLDKPERISYYSTEGYIQRVASEDEGLGHSGPIPHAVLVEELHEHKSGKMLDFYSSGFKNRRQPLLFVITNSGYDKLTCCGEEHDHAVAVAAGDVSDDHYFSYVAALDEGDDIEDESVWPKANPGLPLIPGYDYLRNQLSRSKGIPSKKALVARLNFCIWGGGVDSPWIEREAWIACEERGEQPDEVKLRESRATSARTWP